MKDDCSKHKKEVAGISDMKVLAEIIGDLHYETFAIFLERLSEKLYMDSAKDSAHGRIKLAKVLDTAADNIYWAQIEIEQAWEISKPFMNLKHTQQ